MSIHRVLVVDDDKLSREFLAHATEALGYDSHAVPSGAAALQAESGESLPTPDDARLDPPGVTLAHPCPASDRRSDAQVDC